MANLITYSLVFTTLCIPLIVFASKQKSRKWFYSNENKNKLYVVLGMILIFSELQWLITTVVHGVMVDNERFYALLRGEICTFLSPIMIYALLTKDEKTMKIFSLWFIPGGLFPIMMPGVYSFKGNLWEIYMDSRGLFDHLLNIAIPLFLIFTINWNLKEDIFLVIKGVTYFLIYGFVVLGTLYFSTGNSSFGKYTTAFLEPSNWKGENFGFFSNIGIQYPWSIFALIAVSLSVTTLYLIIAESVWKKFYGETVPEWLVIKE